MGLFSRIKDPVPGTAQVVSSTHPERAAKQNGRFQLVVHVDGMAPYSAEVHQIVSTKKWPWPGSEVPVIVSRSKPEKVRIDEGRMESNRDRARAQADRMAQQLGGSSTTSGVTAGGLGQAGAMSGTPQVNIVGDVSAMTPEQKAKVEQMLGMDLDGDGVVGGAATGASAGDPTLAALERLGRLRAEGVLTDAEFAAEKARILGGR